VPPQPSTDVKTACILTVDNQTQFALTLLDDGHDRGNFVPLPPRTVPPKSSVQFTSVEAPGAKEQGCKGFLLYQVGTPTPVQWRVEWDNPEQAKNTTTSVLTPADPTLRALDQIGQGEDNVPVLFTLTETGGGGARPNPIPIPPIPIPPIPPVPPVPPQGEDPAFEPPFDAKEPTLRRGDKSKDGWVEYLQFLLNHHLKLDFTPNKLAEDGDFGGATEAAVVKFQKEKGLQVDKVVGNQTWAALREGAPEKPSTDGRKPHTFVEQGAEARWDREKKDAFYMHVPDTLQMSIFAVGQTPIEGKLVTLRITPPGGKVRVIKVPIDPATRQLPGGGAQHAINVKQFKATFPAANPAAKATEWKLEAYLDAELGGDRWDGKILSTEV
jgi:peptidoglycan hydrolase-like protein with peptidoglycan-binding domain